VIGTTTGRRGEWASAPAVALLAANAGALPALDGEDVEVAGVGVAPAQVGVQGPGLDGVAAVVEVGDGELSQRSSVACSPDLGTD
jgi:hypothetical protein